MAKYIVWGQVILSAGYLYIYLFVSCFWAGIDKMPRILRPCLLSKRSPRLFSDEFYREVQVVRMTGGNLRLLTRLLTQVERVLGVNDTQVISVEIVEAARDSLVIGQA